MVYKRLKKDFEARIDQILELSKKVGNSKLTKKFFWSVISHSWSVKIGISIETYFLTFLLLRKVNLPNSST